MGKLEGDLKRLRALKRRLLEDYDLSQEIGPRRKPKPPTEPMEPRGAADREGPTPLDVLMSIVIREVEAQIQVTQLRLESPTTNPTTTDPSNSGSGSSGIIDSGGKLLSGTASGVKGLLPSMAGGAILGTLFAGALLVAGGLLVRWFNR